MLFKFKTHTIVIILSLLHYPGFGGPVGEPVDKKHCHRHLGRALITGEIYVSPPTNEITHWKQLFPASTVFSKLPGTQKAYAQAFKIICTLKTGDKKEELFDILRRLGPEAVYMRMAIAFEEIGLHPKFKPALDDSGLKIAFRRLVRNELQFKKPEITVVFTDIRFLKIFNQLGYMQADDTIHEWIKIQSLRAWEAIGVWGGDEFVLVLNETKVNVELGLMARLQEHKEFIVEKYKKEFLEKYDSDPAFKAILDGAIPSGPLSRKDLARLGLLEASSLDETFFNGRNLSTREKLDAAIVVPGSITYGVVSVDVSHLNPASVTDDEIDSLFEIAKSEAQNEFQKNRSLENTVLGVTSRPSGL